MDKREYLERLKAKLVRAEEAYDAALASDNEMLRLKAAEMLEKRVLGDYKQTVEVQADTRTEDELRRDIDEKMKALGITHLPNTPSE